MQGNGFSADVHLRRTLRIRKKKEIDVAFQFGTRLTNEYFRIFIVKNQRSCSRLAISVPRKLCNAVQRNRWKRLLREAFRLNKASIGVGFDLLIIPRMAPKGVKRQNVAERLVSLFQHYRNKVSISQQI